MQGCRHMHSCRQSACQPSPREAPQLQAPGTPESAGVDSASVSASPEPSSSAAACCCCRLSFFFSFFFCSLRLALLPGLAAVAGAAMGAERGGSGGLPLGAAGGGGGAGLGAATGEIASSSRPTSIL